MAEIVSQRPVAGARQWWAVDVMKLPLKPAGAGIMSVLGAALVLGVIWQAASVLSDRDLPGPVSTIEVFWGMVKEPFYDNGPNDKGVGLQVAASLQRVALGFVLGTLAAVPLGVLLGMSGVARRVLDPIVQVLRPISPLAWFPIGLAAAHSVGAATVFIIFITSIWPTVVNTAFGVSSIPDSHKNVARVFQFSRWTYMRRIVLPYSLPYIITGLRLGMGIAWLVIVAGEMLSGAKGIGWFVWDSWNALDLQKVMSAVLIIGVVGLVLDRAFLFLVRRVSYGEAS